MEYTFVKYTVKTGKLTIHQSVEIHHLLHEVQSAMGIVLKICLLFLGCGATILALSGDALDKPEDDRGKSRLPKFNWRGKWSIGLLLLALVLGIVDAYLSDAAEQEKIDRLIANGLAIEQTTTRLGGIRDDLTDVSKSQSNVLGSLQRNKEQIATTRQELEKNLHTTNEVLGRSETIEQNLMRLPRVVVSAEQPINSPVTKFPANHSIKRGNILRYTIVSNNGLSRDDLAGWQLEIRVGEQKHRVYDLTGEIIAGGQDGQRHEILVTHPNKIEAAISYSIYEIGQ